MTTTNYAFQEYEEETMSRAYGRALSISTKKSVEVCNWIKGKNLSSALKMLEEVAAMKRAVPYSRFNQELAHQKATGPGGYPINVAKNIMIILKSAEANASSKGLNTSSLRIVHICAHLGSRPYRHGRKRRVKAKRTHIEVVLQEVAQKSKSTKKESKKSKESKTNVSKTETSKVMAEEKSEAPKPTSEEKSEEKSENKHEDKPEGKMGTEAEDLKEERKTDEVKEVAVPNNDDNDDEKKSKVDAE